METGPFRRIIGSRFLTGYSGCNRGAGSVRLDLECGHTTYRKASKAPRRRARCWECRPNEVAE